GARATDRTCVLRASAAAGHSPSPVAGRFPQRFHPAGLNALATSSVTRPALVRVGSSRRVLIKIGFGGGRATLSYCDWSGTGSKFFSNHSIMAIAEDGGSGQGVKTGRQHVCDLVLVGDRACRGGHRRDRIRHSNQ